jgi:NADH-quinone oxidoreductase subunit M
MQDIPLSIPLFVPLAGGLVTLLVPARGARVVACVSSAVTLALAVVLLFGFDQHASALQDVTNTNWISALGIHYALGIDGLNLFLILLTAVLWLFGSLYAALSSWERPRLFFFHLGLAETAVLGAFLAQDLALYVVFFDLMLVPFYFLIGGWGGDNRVNATTKFVIYTLVGSLLMLVAAVALGVLSTPPGGHLSFLFSDLSQHSIGFGVQDWIFLLFAAAFLVKAPAFPFHGWMPDTYRTTPIPVLMLLSGVLAKVGVYGFLRIVLPILPHATQHFQELVIVIAVVSILYGSVLAFSQDNTRLVVGYSSIAQLGFITLGIFSLDPKGGQGAVLQMVNHGLVVAALFVIIAVLARCAKGSESLERMGGIAFRAPVLASLFLIVALATLAMPGSPNFVAELLILFGTFQSKLAFGIVASIGVVLASVYMLRFFIRSMHNRVGSEVESRDLRIGELAVIAPLVCLIIGLGIYPQLVLGRTELATSSRVDHAARPVLAGKPIGTESVASQSTNHNNPTRPGR